MTSLNLPLAWATVHAGELMNSTAPAFNLKFMRAISVFGEHEDSLLLRAYDLPSHKSSRQRRHAYRREVDEAAVV
jgi:hypothetical protein